MSCVQYIASRHQRRQSRAGSTISRSMALKTHLNGDVKPFQLRPRLALTVIHVHLDAVIRQRQVIREISGLTHA